MTPCLTKTVQPCTSTERGVGVPDPLSKSDEEYGPEYDENILFFEFRYDLLGDAQFEVPLVFVNCEARGIALAWVREQGIELRSRENRQNPIFVRPFDPMRDALYVALDKQRKRKNSINAHQKENGKS